MLTSEQIQFFDYITGVVAALLASKHEEWLPSYKGDDLKYWSISQHKNVTQLYGGRIFNLTSANGERCDNFGSLQKVGNDSHTIYNLAKQRIFRPVQFYLGLEQWVCVQCEFVILMPLLYLPSKILHFTSSA